MYTDYVGNPIAAGDTICYGVKSGSSAVNMVLALVKEVVPIHPINPGNLDDSRGFTDDDLAKGKGDYEARQIPTRAVEKPGTPVVDRARDDSKAYLLKVNRLQDGWGGWYRVDSNKVITVHNVTNVVVVNLPEASDG